MQIETAVVNDEVVEDDEAVRCICGFDDYPGPPQLSEEDKIGVKVGIEEPIVSVADATEDLAGFFVQCDVCKVWQHGGCVGIMNEDTSPDEYFCEQCRKDLHQIYTALNEYVFAVLLPFSFFAHSRRPQAETQQRGADMVLQGWLLQVCAIARRTSHCDSYNMIANMVEHRQRYSHYLPLQRQNSSRNSSRAASYSKDGTRSPRGKHARPPSSLQSAKRRSTMNSRDAAYDEEEQLRRAIEASKGEKSGESTAGSTRRGKRGRSDSEE